MNQQDIDNIISHLQNSVNSLSNRQKDTLNALIKDSRNLNLKQLKRLFYLAIVTRNYPICPACNLPITNHKEFSLDHIYPASKGGLNCLHNLQPMHKQCNELKGCEIQVKYFIEYEITLTIKKEIVKNHERRKQKKRRNSKWLKPWQIKHNNDKSR